LGGLSDLDSKLIRILHPDSFLDDPTRIFRGARYAARLGGAFEPFTYEKAKLAVSKGALSTISYYRIGNEFRWILAEDNAVAALELLKDLKVFEWIQFGPPPNIEMAVKVLRELQDSAPKVNLEFARMEIPVFLLLMTSNISKEARAQLFLEWGFGKRGVARAQDALEECGVKFPGVVS
jgi:tRNA nucleotidyltransferase (CCA-adding enzyme)